MNQKKMEWEKPQLIILDRIHKDESVLLQCLSHPSVCNQKPERDGSQQ